VQFAEFYLVLPLPLDSHSLRSIPSNIPSLNDIIPLDATYSLRSQVAVKINPIYDISLKIKKPGVGVHQAAVVSLQVRGETCKRGSQIYKDIVILQSIFFTRNYYVCSLDANPTHSQNNCSFLCRHI